MGRFEWQGIDDPNRTDLAFLSLGADRMTGHGTSLCDAYALSWALDVGPGWVTRSLQASVFGRTWSRSLVLVRGERGSWTASTRSDGDVDLPSPGLSDPYSVQGAIDCDLGLCPVTNTMPIRRLGLLSGGVPETPLVMAWIDVPSLRVIRSDQVYASGDPGSVRYRSYSRDFHAALTVDDDGVVLDYPGLARRVRE